MATELNGASTEAPPSPQKEKEKPKENNAPKSAAVATATTPKLSNAELKAKAKAEKAARRAQTKEAKAVSAPAATTTAAGGPPADGKVGKGGKPKQEGPTHQQSAQTTGRPPQRRPSTAARRPSVVSGEKDARSTIPECFSHLPMAKRVPITQAGKDVHPAVLALGQQMATFTVRDSISRLEGTLLAFRKVLEEYETPEGDALTRHFVSHVLNPQIEYLTECRPMCFAMGNAIRLLKAQIRKFDINTPQDEAKEGLLETINDFIRERITLAEFVIARNAAEMISATGDRIVTYGRHRLVERTLLRARESGKQFSVHVVDDPYDQTGQELAKALRREGISVSYSPHLGGLAASLQTATKALLGTEAMFANGSLYGAVGTSDVCVAARDAGVPVIALCETINFDADRVATDSLTYNEIDPERCSGESFRLLFDTTRSEYVSVVVTEYESETGNAPAASILSILSKHEDPSAS